MNKTSVQYESLSASMTDHSVQYGPSPNVGHSKSIKEIHISEDANFLEYIPTNGITNPNKNIVLKINNVELTEPPIHPITNNKGDQSRPRHFTTPEMIKHLDPICLDRTIGSHHIDDTEDDEYNNDRILNSSADVLNVIFDKSGRTNHVLYASESSDNNHLKNAYRLFNKYHKYFEHLLNTVPKEALIIDELAGGCYGEYFFVVIDHREFTFS